MAIATATQLGELGSLDTLTRGYVDDSVAAKVAAHRAAISSGTPYRDPVGPSPAPATVNPPTPTDNRAAI